MPSKKYLPLATTFREDEVSALITLVRKSSTNTDLQRIANSADVGSALRKLVKLQEKAARLRKEAA